MYVFRIWLPNQFDQATCRSWQNARASASAWLARMRSGNAPRGCHVAVSTRCRAGQQHVASKSVSDVVVKHNKRVLTVI